MSKNGSCDSQSKFWWGVLAGVILAAALHVLVSGRCCRMGGGPGCGPCPMMGGPAPMQKAPASK